MVSSVTVSSNSESVDETRLERAGVPLVERRGDAINILLVDDEPKNLTVLETVLSDPSYRLVRANSADDALLALVREEFALIVLDIQMPGMSGFELAQMVKQRKKTAGVPIIFLTAYYSEAEHVLEGYGSGAVDYLHKPVNPAILRSKVAVFATLHRNARELERANGALLVEVAERRRVEEQLLQLNNELEERVEQRTSDLILANKAISESEELLRLAQEAGRVGIWEWNLKTGYGIWTPAAWSIYDSQGPRVDVTFSKWLSCIHPEDRERAERAVEDAKAIGSYWDEVRVNCPDDSAKWIELVGAVEYEGDEPIRMRGAVRDITDRKAIELELKEAHRRKDEFLAILAHELRNPLAPIHNALQVLRLTENNPQRFSEVREIMERQLVQMVRLVDDLLDISRISTGKIELRLERLEVRKVLQSAIETSSPLIERANHELTVEIPETPLWVLGDFTRLNQVVSNLLNNSAKYTPEGGHIWLSVRQDGLDVVITVKDTGIGIPMSMLPYVFDMFTQIDRSLNRAQGGLGIGLSLVRRLVAMHGGNVAASSEGEGLGSEFVVRLPLADASAN